MCRSGSSILAAIAFVAAACAGSPHDWAQYNYDNRGWRFNHAEETLTPENVSQLVLKWRFPREDSGLSIGPINATPIVVDGFVYVGVASSPVFYKLTPDGSVAWAYGNARTPDAIGERGRLTPSGQFGLTSGGFYNSALVTNDSVYAGDTSGFIYCLDSVSGLERWKVDMRSKSFAVHHPKNQTMGSPIIADGKLIMVGGAFEHDAWADANRECCTGRGFLVALEPDSGELVWKYVLGPEPQRLEPPIVINDEWGPHQFHFGPSTSSIWSTPSYDPDTRTLFFGTDTNNSPRQPSKEEPRTHTLETCAVVAVDVTTGEQKWVTQLNQGDVWNSEMRPYDPATGRYLDCSIGDTPKIFSVDVEGKQAKVVGVGCKNGAFYVLHAGDGRIFQSTPVYAGTPTNPPSPEPDPRMLAFPSPIGGLQTGCATDGKAVFTNGVDWLALSAKERRPGRIDSLLPPTGGRVTSISLDTRTENWRREMPMVKTPRWPGRAVGDPVASGIALANGVAYFTTIMGGKLVALNSATGERLHEISLPPVWSGPSVSRGRVYVGSGSIFKKETQQGAVFCFGLPDRD